MGKHSADERWQIDRDEYLRYRRVTRAAKRGVMRAMLKLPCVTGMGLGLKKKDGDVTRSLAMIVGVIKKASLRQLPMGEVIPRSVSIPNPDSPKEDITIQTDVLETGVIRPSGIECDRERPCRPGYSVAHEDVSCGTLGCWVVENGTYEILFLSNNHVLANSNKGSIGDHIYQPCPYCAGTPSSNQFGTLHNFVQLQGSQNLVDAAVGKPLASGWCDPLVIGIGEPTGTVDLDASHLGSQLSGFGNRSGVHTGSTRNQILSVDFDTGPLDYSTGRKSQQSFSFIDQILLDNETKQPYIPGDSGTALLLEDGSEVLVGGLLFAGSDTVAVGSHIRNVFSALNISLCVVESGSASAATTYSLRQLRDDVLRRTPLGADVVRAFRQHGLSLAAVVLARPELRQRLTALGTDVATEFQRGNITLANPLPAGILSELHALVGELGEVADPDVRDLVAQASDILQSKGKEQLEGLLQGHLRLREKRKE